MVEKTIKQIEQELLEVKVARLINLQNGVVIKKDATFAQIVFSQQDTSRKIIALLREYLI